MQERCPFFPMMPVDLIEDITSSYQTFHLSFSLSHHGSSNTAKNSLLSVLGTSVPQEERDAFQKM